MFYLFYKYELNYVSITKLWNSSDHLISSKLTIRVKNISNTGLPNTAVKGRACVRGSDFVGRAPIPAQNFKGQLKKTTAVLQNRREDIERSWKSFNRLKILNHCR